MEFTKMTKIRFFYITKNETVARRRRKYTLGWCCEDVQVECPELKLTRQEAMDLFWEIEDNFNPGIGVNWEVIRDTAEELFPKQELPERLLARKENRKAGKKAETLDLFC
jgi:hypothetical protein